MKRVLTLLLFLTLLSSFASANQVSSWSTDRTKYWEYNSSIFLFDDMNNTILNGTNPYTNPLVNNTDPRKAGWQGDTTTTTYRINSVPNMSKNHIFIGQGGGTHLIMAINQYSGVCLDILSRTDDLTNMQLIFSPSVRFLLSQTGDCSSNTNLCFLNGGSWIDIMPRPNKILTVCNIWNSSLGIDQFYIDDKAWFNITFEPKTKIDFYTNTFDVLISNVRVWNVSAYGKDGPQAEYTPPPSNTEAPNITTPLNNYHSNTNLSINCSHVGSDVLLSLFVNHNLYLNNISSNKINFTSNFSDGAYILDCKAFNSTTGLASSTNSTVNFYIDTVAPNIYIRSSNGFQLDNNSIVNKYITNLTLNISFQDDNLGEVLINITNSTGQSVYSYYNSSTYFATNTYFNVTKLIDISNLPLGTYYGLVQDSDLHTLLSIKPYSLVKTTDKLSYHTTEDINIEIKCLDKTLTSLDTVKQTDRYSFSSDCYNWRVTSSELLVYIVDSKNYNAHFVTRKGIKGNWIDFNSKGLTKDNYKVEKIDNYNYKVSIINLLEKDLGRSLVYESIGGLNVNTIFITFSIGSVADFIAYNKLTNERIAFGVSYNGYSYNSNITETLRLINFTRGVVNLTINSTGYEPLVYTFNVTEAYYNLTMNLTPIGVTTYFIDEITNNPINSQVLTLYIEKSDLTYSNTYFNVSTNPFVITGLSNGLYNIYAYNSIYPRRQLLNLSITNTSGALVNMYLINTTYGTEKQFRVVTPSQIGIEGVKVDIKLLINGTFQTIDQEKTDYAGQFVLYMNPNSLYRFNLTSSSYSNKLLELIPISSSYTFTLDEAIPNVYSNVYEGVRYKILTDNQLGFNKLLNISDIPHNITLIVEGANVNEMGINITHSDYNCIPADCSITNNVAGQVSLLVNVSKTGGFNIAFFFKQVGGNKVYLNDDRASGVPFLEKANHNLYDLMVDLKGLTSESQRSVIVAVLDVIALGFGSMLGLYGMALVIPVLAVNIILALPSIALIDPMLAIILSIFGVAMFLYSSMREM